MFRMTMLSAIALLVACLCAGASGQQVANSAAGVGDWPHWAGPKGDCTSDEKGLLKEWPKEGLKVLWRIPVGTGSNHPSVAGDDLCFNELDATQSKETVRCVDANTGKEKWSHTNAVPPVYAVGWGELGPRATPTITDKYVYTIGTFGDGFCFERATGKVVWTHDFKEESPYLNGSLVKGREWKSYNAYYGDLEWKGFNGSLIPIGDKIIMFYWQGGIPACPAWAKTDVSSKMQVFAYDANTGKVAWKFEEDCKPGTRGGGLNTGGGLPITFRNEECIAIHGNREWKILRRSDGKQVWHWECAGPDAQWANGGLGPYGANLYFDSLDGLQTSLVECDFSRPDPKPKVLWTRPAMHEAITPAVILDGYMYGLYVEKRNEAYALGDKPGEANFSLRCSDMKTWEVKWSRPGFHMGLSMSAAEGLLYVRSHQTLTLVEATPNGYVEKGRMEKLHALTNVGRGSHQGLLDWNMPVISRGRLFIRTPGEIICYDIKDPNAK